MSHRGEQSSIPQKVCVGFIVDKVILGQVFLRVLWFYPVSIIPQKLPIHPLIYYRCYDLNS